MDTEVRAVDADLVGADCQVYRLVENITRSGVLAARHAVVSET